MEFKQGHTPPDTITPAPRADGYVRSRPALPILCSPEAYRLMRHWADRPDAEGALLHGAAAVAMHARPETNPDAIARKLNAIAETVRGRVRGSQEQALLAHLHHHLFDELGFAGDRADYYNPANSDLGQVLTRRRGLPILLALVYREIAQRIGLECEGVALPGHFVVRVQTGTGPMMVDPFFGGVEITRDEALERVRGTLGEDADEWDEAGLLRPVSGRHWLTRILQNLLGSLSAAGRYGDVAAMLELEMLLWPDQAHLQRDLALCLARVGLGHEAAGFLKRYLAGDPDDPQVPDLRELLTALD